jgi:hypothetical protein
MALQAIREDDGSVVNVGDLLTSFRGERAILKHVTRERVPGKSGKVAVVWVEDMIEKDRVSTVEYYDGVFGLKVVDTERSSCSSCGGTFAKSKRCSNIHHR